VDIQIQVKGIDELVRNLRDLGVNRIPNYVARALNGTAQATQTKMLEETVGNLTVRGSWLRPGTRFGMNLTRASKDNLEAHVFSRASWLFEQETMEFKTAGKSRIAVPMPAVRAGRTDPAKIPRRLKPAQMGAKLFPITTGHGVVLAQRMKRAGLRLMWALERAVHWRRRVHVIDAGMRAAQRHAPKAIENQIAAAIREQGLRLSLLLILGTSGGF